MKRKYVLAGCIISALLILFSFPISADQIPEADAGASSNSAPLLDSYFWDNYNLLPYLESDNSQFIDTAVSPDYNGKTYIKFSFDSFPSNTSAYIFGAYDEDYGTYGSYVNYSNNNAYIFIVSLNTNTQILINNPYSIHEVVIDQHNGYFDGNLVSTNDSNFSFTNDISLFCRKISTTGHSNYSNIKIYNMYYYDYTLNDGEGDFVRYFYPAKSKSSGIMGMYDAVTKTFYTTTGQNPFVDPDNDHVIGFQIGRFITSGLGWITDILDFAVSQPLIIIFFAIGLAGATFRWARRLYHF